MSDFAREVLTVNVQDEMRQSYLDYAMSVIVGRALPDVRDGLKPVHRRVLYGMYEGGYDYNKAYKKSARIVGDVMGKYHPHGDSAIYDAIVRLAQPFSMRYPLVDGQGNFGSIDGDAPAAMRYTEVRMSRIAHELLADIDKETVDFAPNYDESEREPVVLPSRVPNLLINGSSGIAVGMATNIPPHNLGEVLDALKALLDDPELSIEALCQIIKGPDFPTAGEIHGLQGIHEAYRTGRGRVRMRGCTTVEGEADHKQAIIITELPYQVNKARLLTHIAELVKERKIEGITDLRDESNKDGMRVVLELRRGEVPEVILNNLYEHTALESVFAINMVALDHGQPRLFDLKAMLQAFINHRREVVVRRTIYDLRKAREEAHRLEGYAVVIANLDPLLQLIRNAKSRQDAEEALVARPWDAELVATLLARAHGADTRPAGLPPGCGLFAEGYRLSPVQAKAIVELQLHRLTALERDKIIAEFETILKRIADLQDILATPERLRAEVVGEFQELRKRHGDARRTRIIAEHRELAIEDLLANEEMVVTLSHQGYVKAQKASFYQPQRRGGRGRIAFTHKEEDFLERLFLAQTHDVLLSFSSLGKVYWLKVHQLPQGKPQSRGRPIVNLLPLVSGEHIHAVLPVHSFEDPDTYVLLTTRLGTVKKTALQAFSRPRANGIMAIALEAGDRLVDAALIRNSSSVILTSDAGKSICFAAADIRATGRSAAGVRGMRLGSADSVVGVCVYSAQEVEQPHPDQPALLVVTQHGYGKRTALGEYHPQHRGGQGIMTCQRSKRNGAVVGALLVEATDQVMLISSTGSLVRLEVSGIPLLGRNTQGVRLIKLDEGEQVTAVARVAGLGGMTLDEGDEGPREDLSDGNEDFGADHHDDD